MDIFTFEIVQEQGKELRKMRLYYWVEEITIAKS